MLFQLSTASNCHCRCCTLQKHGHDGDNFAIVPYSDMAPGLDALTTVGSHCGKPLWEAIRLWEAFCFAENKENDEATKLEKRIRAVEAIKAKPEHIATTSLPNKPEGPDPYEKMSKRRWEKSMMNWRKELRDKFNGGKT